MKLRHVCDSFKCPTCSPATAKAYDAGRREHDEENERLYLKLEATRIDLDALKAQAARMREALEELTGDMKQDLTPTCMAIKRTIGEREFYEFGPPRTDGWQGWFDEYKASVQKRAREALAAIRGEKG